MGAKSQGEHFRNNLHDRIDEANGCKLIDVLYPIFLWQEKNICGLEPIEVINLRFAKIVFDIHHLHLDNACFLLRDVSDSSLFQLSPAFPLRPLPSPSTPSTAAAAGAGSGCSEHSRAALFPTSPPICPAAASDSQCSTDAEAPYSLSFPSSSSFLLLLTPMAPIRQFSAEEKGKAPREGPDPLPPKKRLVLCHRDEGAQQEAPRPWYERPPPGFPLPLYARVVGPGGEGVEQHRRCRRRRRRVTVVRVVPPGVHAERSSHELVLHAAMPPSSWIRLPPSFTFEMPPSGALELWL